MNRPKNIGLSLTLLVIAVSAFSTAYSEKPADPSKSTAEPSAASDGSKPVENLLPGLVARAYLGGDHPPLQLPTPIVFVIKTGTEFPGGIRQRIEDELRGTMDVGRLEYTATGLIVLNGDTEVRFDIKNMVCKVDGKDFGDGQYTRPMENGVHSIELIRRGWASGKPSFAIAGNAGKPTVLFHTEAALQHEVERSIKVDKQPTKSKLLDQPATTDAPAATPTEIKVTSALFGNGTKTADVTGRVAELLVSESEGFTARADWLHADPIPGKPKALVIAYDYNGKHCLFVALSGGPVNQALLVENAKR